MKNILTIACLLLVHFNVIHAADVADVVYTNGKIYTVNEALPWAEAVAIKDGKFIAVGSVAEIEAVTGKDSKVIDLGGKFVMPGFHDLHVHIEQAYIANMLGDSLMNFPAEETSIEALQGLLKEHAEKNPSLPVLFAGGLEISLFPDNEPTKAFIDDIVPDRPVVMLSATEHEGLLNTNALELEGILADTQSPAGGIIVEDPNTGEPTGLLKEVAAGKWAWKHYPVISIAQN